MGEAKRRKKLDSIYGQIPSLTSVNQKQKHVDLILDQLFSQFDTELKQIAKAESMIELMIVISKKYLFGLINN
jgi:hypothetical protein